MHNSPSTIFFTFLALFDMFLAGDVATAKKEDGLQSGKGPKVQVDSAAPPGTLIDIRGMECTCSSVNEGNGCGLAVDGDTSTFWHSKFKPEDEPLPHTFTIDFKEVTLINGMALVSRQDGSNHGRVYMHEIRCDDKLVAYGTWAADEFEKFSTFQPIGCRKVSLTHTKGVDDQPWTCIAELKFFKPDAAATKDTTLGAWLHTIDMPMVPSACAVNHKGQVIAWASWTGHQFTNGPGGETITSVVDMEKMTVTERMVTETDHDMFCPGISTGQRGVMVVTGGNNAAKASIYNMEDDTWSPAPDMTIPRGYPASTTCSDGRMFVIGGSWSGGAGGKNGEIFDLNTKQWTGLPGCRVDPMVTGDRQGVYRGDNHGWLFGWKGNTVFQAGPSKNMNWYSVDGEGAVKGAGTRAGDNDAMCGTAVMWDEGEICTFGGSPDYSDSEASNNAFCMTIKDPNTNVDVRPVTKMAFRRIFHNAVVMPDGNIWICCGQEVGQPFSDDKSHTTPEIYNPVDDTMKQLSPGNVPRNYHSTAVLLKDGCIASGGSGLCGTCTTNHPNFQVYCPPYHFDKDGNEAVRPKIISMSTENTVHGDTVTMKTDSEVASACIIRLGSTTHTVNTDQRRISLKVEKQQQRNGDPFTCSFKVPDDPGVCIPGYYWVFVLNDQGVPCVARILHVGLKKKN